MKPLTAVAVLLCAACQALIVVGQLFLKHAVSGGEDRKTDAGPATVDASTLTAGPARQRPVVRNFVLGIGCMTLWFFLWLGLLSQYDLSKLFPYEGLNPALLAVAAWVVLKERLPFSAWVGLSLICLGIAVVSGS